MQRSFGARQFTPLLAGVGLGVAGLLGRRQLTVYGAGLLGFLAVKTALSFNRRTWDPSEDQQEVLDDLRVAVVVPFYNEDPGFFEALLESLTKQERQPDEVWLVDDGSGTRECLALSRTWGHDQPFDVVVARLEHAGKREALGLAFRDSDADIFVTVDSDTTLDTLALGETVKPFMDPKIHGVTGLVLAANHDRNLLTRIIDVRYANAFLWDRAAYSALGSVLCTCGSLAAYRSSTVRKHLDDFLNQSFLGERAIFGDDRRLTNYALLEGNVVLQESARAYTAVPERFSHYVNQQIRWNKSFVRESIWSLKNHSPRRVPFWLTFMEVGSWTVFGASVLVATYIRPFRRNPKTLVGYAVGVVAMSYVRSARYLDARDDLTVMERLKGYALAPAYGVLHVTVLMPLRLFSLVTLQTNTWRTRTRVEVSLAQR